MSSSLCAHQCHNSPFALAESAWVGMSFTSHLEFLLMADIAFTSRDLFSTTSELGRQARQPIQFGNKK